MRQRFYINQMKAEMTRCDRQLEEKEMCASAVELCGYRSPFLITLSCYYVVIILYQYITVLYVNITQFVRLDDWTMTTVFDLL